MIIKTNYPWEEGYAYEQKYNYYNEDRNAGYYFHEAINKKYDHIEEIIHKKIVTKKYVF